MAFNLYLFCYLIKYYVYNIFVLLMCFEFKLFDLILNNFEFFLHIPLFLILIIYSFNLKNNNKINFIIIFQIIFFFFLVNYFNNLFI